MNVLFYAINETKNNQNLIIKDKKYYISIKCIAKSEFQHKIEINYQKNDIKTYILNVIKIFKFPKVDFFK